MTIVQRLPTVRGKYRENAELAKMCWFATGGPAEVLYIPDDAEDLVDFLQNKPQDIPIFMLGVGSNMLIRDGGINGVVIRLGREFNYVKISDNRVITGAATLDLNVAETAMNYGISGLEFLSGIPGTIGGALTMNAGAYGNDVGNCLESAVAIGMDGEKVILTAKDFGYFYRGNSLNKKYIFIEATFVGSIADREAIQEKINYIKGQRNITQPVKSRTGGSTFKNPPNISFKAWQLIDTAGCRGMTIGDASVSELHCNFILNNGNATSNDLEQLMLEVQRRVLECSGIMLESEIMIIGNSHTINSNAEEDKGIYIDKLSDAAKLNQRKRLLYQSTHRGCKEMDIILGNFATKHLPELSAELLDGYDEILQLNDDTAYDFIVHPQNNHAALSQNAQKVLKLIIAKD